MQISEPEKWAVPYSTNPCPTFLPHPFCGTLKKDTKVRSAGRPMDASAVQCTSNFTLSALVHRQCVAEDARGLLRDADSDEIASHYSALSEDEALSHTRTQDLRL